MALARNIKRNNRKSFRLPKFKKNVWIVIGAIALLIGAYGILNISRIASLAKEKKEIKFDTGDKPLPQTINLWVTADGGLKMREKPDIKSELVFLIPNGTQLTATETSGEWYKVSFMNKEGWVNKTYVTTQAPAEDPTKNWKVFSNKSFGYSLRYPSEWVVQDYGANPASGSLSYVGFGTQLSPNLDPNLLPPVVIRVSDRSQEQLESNYKGMANSIPESVTVSGMAGTKYTYNSSTGVQMTTYLIPKSTQVIIIEESGGYSDELNKIIGSISLG